MKAFIYTTLIVCLFFAAETQNSFGQTADSAKQQLIEKFKSNSKTDHKSAYESAKEFFRQFPNESTDDVEYMKKWIAAYEKVGVGSQSQTQVTNNRVSTTPSNNAPSSEVETTEITEARLAITKYRDYPAAIKALESSSEETKKKLLWISYMATAQEGAGNIKEALTYLRKYGELVPDHQPTKEKIADLRYQLNKKQELQKSVLQKPELLKQEESFYENGMAFYKKQEYDKAIAEFSKAIEINPQSAEAYFTRGYVYYQKKDYERAIDDYSKAIEIYPEYLLAYQNRIDAYRRIGRKDLAKSDEKKADQLYKQKYK